LGGIGRSGGDGVRMRGSAAYGKIISGFVRVGDGGPSPCLTADCTTILSQIWVACRRVVVSVSYRMAVPRCSGSQEDQSCSGPLGFVAVL